AQRWLGDVLALSLGGFEAPVWCRCYRAWEVGNGDAVRQWNDVFLAARESAEFRAETVQMGYSLRKLFTDSGEFNESQLMPLQSMEHPAFPTSFSFACAAWCIPQRQGLL